MAWWRAARFGMFIHFGLYSIPAGKWHGTSTTGTASEWLIHDLKLDANEYARELLPQFNPTKFDAERWVRIAKDAEMKYIVVTTKHHDGFCLFDSQFTDYDVMSTPFQRDIMKELSDAARRQGITICWYYSIMDWHHPDAQSPESWPRYVEVMKGQLKELLTNYGRIGVLWFDGEWDPKWTEQQGRALYAYLRNIQPDLIINNRIGNTRAGFSGISARGGIGDFFTPEQQIPETDPGGDWESCITMNGSWGFKADDQNWKSAGDLIRMLTDITSKNGNFLLNVGPTGEGEISPESVQRLAEIGQWMRSKVPSGRP
jgi:alpha-L-fucosidase